MELYNVEAASPEHPILPFFETSCMDAAEPYVGDRPCCSTSRPDRCGQTVLFIGNMDGLCCRLSFCLSLMQPTLLFALDSSHQSTPRGSSH